MKRIYILFILIVSYLAVSAQAGQGGFKVSTLYGSYTVIDAVPMPVSRIGSSPHDYKGMKVSLAAKVVEVAGDTCTKPVYEEGVKNDADKYLQEGYGISAERLGIKAKEVITVSLTCEEEAKLKYADSMPFECALIWDGITLYVYHDMQILKLKRSK